MMANLLKLGALSTVVLAMTGCIGTKSLSYGISDDGIVQQENIVFPALEDSWNKQGQFPNSESLSKIRAGVSKDELYQLIGAPHFREDNRAREWDYILKFYRPDESVQICQYKIIFDKQYKGQEFYWSPADCINYVRPLQPDRPIPAHLIPMDHTPPAIEPLPASDTALPIVMTDPPIISEKIDLSVDALFHFDGHKREDILPQGMAELNNLANKLSQYGRQGDMQIVVTGHTDRLGDDMYNLNLSLLRAQTVRNYLVSRGINESAIWATGVGEKKPVKECSDNPNRKITIACLQPNRRVEVAVSVYAQH